MLTFSLLVDFTRLSTSDSQLKPSTNGAVMAGNSTAKVPDMFLSQINLQQPYSPSFFPLRELSFQSISLFIVLISSMFVLLSLSSYAVLAFGLVLVFFLLVS